MFYAALLITVGIVGGLLYFYYNSVIQYNVSKPYQSEFELNIVIGNANNSSETNSTIPGDIGVANGFWAYHALDRYGVDGRAPIYTLDQTGLIRIQSTVATNYTLGDFFLIWGVTFNDTCIQTQVGGHTYCQNAKQFLALDMYVNGGTISNAYSTYVPLPNDVIRIAYENLQP